MWGMILAVLSTLLLFWHKLSFPKRKRKNTEMYTLIIPARNEAENLKRLLPTIVSEDPQREIIVVDDDSEDGTWVAAESFGVKVVDNPPLPPGWMGKSWACYNGAKAANGKTFVFLDADTWFSDGGTDRLVDVFDGEGSVLTVHPFHEMRSFWEKLSGVFHLVVMASSGLTTVFKERLGTQGGFGPCLVIAADTYWKLGGHETIREEIVEHLAFTRLAASKGLKTKAYSGRGVLNMRMYDSDLKQVVEGWAKSFSTGAKTASPIMTFANVVWLTAVLSFLINLPVLGVWGDVGYVALAILMHRSWGGIGNFKWYDSLLFPLHFFFFVFVFAYSLWKTFFVRQTTWKGRSIVDKKRSSS
ncbi:glycosyltransferase [Halobacillus litoralis]|uniref:4,4'-diaponeurosporenoate glycosyltransferase n=1 Tax=Halobacillus litoralis TaxID=45668 RepID=A0A845E2J9_9BACI|nr:glycosyltransferase [Halobacillus litoralis]MYL49987.1 glycosyltransferase [Halobacillus litoralis]